jgi:aryl-alcohol dehydrogenase-like predicted oxidoreductase
MDYALSAASISGTRPRCIPARPDPKTQGNTERHIGSWLEKTGKRHEIVLASKVAGQGAPSAACLDAQGRRAHPPDQGPDRRGGRRLAARLKTDYLDLYQLHWPDRPVRVFGGQGYKDYAQDYESFGDILEALDAHVKKGSIRHVGVSNEFPWGVMRFLAESEGPSGGGGLPRIASIQNAYHLANRTFEYGLAEIAMREQVGLLAYSPWPRAADRQVSGRRPAGRFAQGALQPHAALRGPRRRGGDSAPMSTWPRPSSASTRPSWP